MPAGYKSPRWSIEMPDCSMPMTFDTYNVCSYGCLYCFSAYQREIGSSKEAYQKKEVHSVSIESVTKKFLQPDTSQFGRYVKARRPMQWGGLSDQFDEFERKYGVTLELMRFFRDLEYPLSFSTKSTWWTKDERYTRLFEGMPWHVKFSIITDDEEKVRVVERGVDSTSERFAAMERAAGFARAVTLRLRPFILGITDPREGGVPGHVRLIERAARAGADSVSTEFFCLEQRSQGGLKWRYPALSKVAGYDIVKFYQRFSQVNGYKRLNRNIKRPYVDEMEAAARDNGLRFYVSDAHFKERCANGSCCGLAEEWNYTRGQLGEGLVLARRRYEQTGRGWVAWSDIAPDLYSILGNVDFKTADGLNSQDQETVGKYRHVRLFDVLRDRWNKPNAGGSPYKAHGGILKPAGTDEEGNVVYEYDPSKA